MEIFKNHEISQSDMKGAFCSRAFIVVSWIKGIDHRKETGKMDRQESVDIYHVDSLLTGEERAFRDKVRNFEELRN